MHENHQVSQWCCGALFSLAFHEVPQGKRDVFKSGACEKVERVMGTFPDSQEVQQWAMRVVAAMAFGEDASMIRAAMSEGGFPVRILTAMEDHSGVTAVQFWGLYALANLTVKDASLGERVMRLIKAGAVERILSAMRRHSGSPDVQMRGCRVLFHLCNSSSFDAGCSEVPLLLMDAGAMVLVGDALSAHAGHAGVLDEAKLVLEVLNNEASKRRQTKQEI